MPTYEYICEACGNEFENFASMSAPPVKKCPKCKKNKVHRKISTGGGIIFKGGGFYETDYRGDAYKKAAEADKPGSGDAKPAETGPGDAATPAAATATETKPPASDSTTKAAEPKAATTKSESKPAAPTPPPAAKSSSSKTRKR